MSKRITKRLTDEPVGIGDGARTVFAPTFLGKPTRLATEVTSTYRRDWRGRQRLSREPRTNFLADSDVTASLIGRVPSVGSFPPGWVTVVGPFGGWTREIVGKGVLPDGTPYVDYRLSGASNASYVRFFDIVFQSAPVPASRGSIWTVSVGLQVIAGDPEAGFREPLRQLVLAECDRNGQYLVSSVLGCVGCHTPQGGALLSGTDCFVKSGTTGCLSSANLTNDPSGLMNRSDQQIKDAITKGIDPDAPTKFLFSNMPYYQFANLTDADANAIVAYLRTVPGVSHTVQAATAPFDVQPSAADWAPVDPTLLPAAGATSGHANGKYLATLACVTCHTANATGTPTHIDAAKAFQGGKVVTATVSGTSKSVQTSNLTPDATGLMSWNVSQVAAAITTGKDKSGATICGMRALANMTSSDAIDIGTYLLGIPAVANAITMTCQ